jgi:CheY-like chemotaxis protein
MVTFMTASSELSLEEKAKEIPQACLLYKPFEIEEIYNIINKKVTVSKLSPCILELMEEECRERILVVDDEIETRDVCRRLFSKKGYAVKFPEDGKRALEMVRDNRFQVVLADLKMPGMDGPTLLKWIKEKYPKTEVIIITGYGSINTAVNAMRIGAYDYIVNPFDINELNLVVGRCLQK